MKIERIEVGLMQTNCYLIISGGESAVIDPGFEAEKIIGEVAKMKIRPKYIINTHYHFDHTMANMKIKKATGASILIHEAEKDYIKFPVDKFLRDGDEIKVGKIKMKVVNFPGHTKGSICLFGDDFVFAGDIIFKEGRGRTDLAGGSEDEMRRSLLEIKKILKPDIMIYPGHGEAFKI